MPAIPVTSLNPSQARPKRRPKCVEEIQPLFVLCPLYTEQLCFCGVFKLAFASECCNAVEHEKKTMQLEDDE